MAFNDVLDPMEAELKGQLEKFAELRQAHIEEVEAAKAAVVIAPPVSEDASEQEKLDAAVKPFQDRIAELESKLAEPDQTPYAQGDIDEAVAKAVAEAKEQAAKDVEAAGKDKDAKEEAIGAALEALAQQVRALTLTKDGAAPAEESAPQAPVEQTPVGADESAPVDQQP